MTLASVREDLVNRLSTIGGLRVYATPPTVVQQFPAALLTQGEPFASYDQVLGAADVRYFFQVLLLVSSGDEAQALSDLEPYISPTGDASVKAAVDGDLGGAADWARVSTVTAAGQITYRRASFWGVAFRVEVYKSGWPPVGAQGLAALRHKTWPGQPGSGYGEVCQPGPNNGGP